MKAGTTSLFNYLSTHPDLVPCKTKEPNFFRTKEDFAKGLNWYESLFEGNGRYAYEASTNYTKRHICPGVPERMHSILPDAKLIYLLRDPIERTLSHYRHTYAKGWESRPFSEFINDNIGNDFVQTSKYWSQIQPFFKFYSENQIMIVDSRNLLVNTMEALKSICEFLNISSTFNETVVNKKYGQSKDFSRPSKFEVKINQQNKSTLVGKIIHKVGKPFRSSVEKPELTREDKEKLIEIFKHDCQNLREYFGLEFSHWSL